MFYLILFVIILYLTKKLIDYCIYISNRKYIDDVCQYENLRKWLFIK